MTTDTKPIELSVVIASLDAQPSLPACLRAWQQQTGQPNLELIVATQDSASAELVRREFPGVRLVELPAKALIPDLWGAGLKQAQGEYVAITTAHCLPAKTWTETALQIMRTGDYAAVGGAIEALQPLNSRDWAVYFLRYSQYMWPFRANKVHDLPGDNVVYRRSNLAPYLDGTSFWENEVHPKMRKDGLTLYSTPDLIMYHQASPPLSAFFQQRFRHGRRFGAQRVAGAGSTGKLKYIATSPLIPLVFGYRISRRVLTKGRHPLAFVAGLPVLLVFLLGWWLGEVYGYLTGPEK